jgi:histidinol-phosphate aminotransferase
MSNHAVSRRTFSQVLGASALLAAVPPIVRAASPTTEVRLNANENPFGPSPAAMRAMTEALSLAPRYPDAQEEGLVADLAHLHGVTTDQILLGIGSSDLLRLAASAFLGPGRTAVMADPTFEIIALHGGAWGATLRRVPLTAAYAHDLEKMDGGSLVYICNPNNPTATITPKAAMRAFLDRTPASTIVVVDEAYHHYATSSDYESVLPLIATHPNLVVVRTFSKIYALAGLRCGYAVAQKALIEKLQGQQQFNVSNIMALVAARASVTDPRHAAAAQKQNSDTKAWLSKELGKMGLTHLPSEANFMMIDLGTDIGPLNKAMREKNVHVGRRFPAMPKHMRITIGTPEEMRRFTTALREVMGAAKA